MRDDPVGQVTERVTHDAPADRRRLDEADGMVLARRGALQVDCPLDEVDVDDLASTRPLVAVVGVGERQGEAQLPRVGVAPHVDRRGFVQVSGRIGPSIQRLAERP